MFLVSGVPNAHALFGVAIVRALAEEVFGAVDYGHVSTLEEFQTLFQARKGRALIAFVEAPEPSVCRLLARSKTKIAVFEEGLEGVTGFLMAHHRADFRSAVRYATLCASSLAALSAVGQAAAFAPPAEGARLLGFIQSLALFYGLQPDEGLVAGVAARLSLDGIDARTGLAEAMAVRFPAAAAVDHVLNALPPIERRILADLAIGYDGSSPGGAALSCAWPPAFCLSGDELDAYLRNPIDLIGRARTLSYGPYLHLPAGEWQLEIGLAVADNHSGNCVEITVSENGVAKASECFALPVLARMEASMPLVIDDPRHPIEIIVKTLEGAIEGSLSLETIRFVRQGAPSNIPDQRSVHYLK